MKKIESRHVRTDFYLEALVQDDIRTWRHLQLGRARNVQESPSSWIEGALADGRRTLCQWV
jgi:hypothetical protein